MIYIVFCVWLSHGIGSNLLASENVIRGVYEYRAIREGMQTCEMVVGGKHACWNISGLRHMICFQKFKKLVWGISEVCQFFYVRQRLEPDNLDFFGQTDELRAGVQKASANHEETETDLLGGM